MKGYTIFKKTKQAVFENDSSILMIAEDSTDWPQVTSPVHYGGLGFNYKWNMGWMNDVLKYMEAAFFRLEKCTLSHDFFTYICLLRKLCFPFSHDEVVHGKKVIVK